MPALLRRKATGVRRLLGKLSCALGRHDVKDGPYISSDHFVDTSYCARCDTRWGYGWSFMTRDGLDKWERRGRRNALELMLDNP